MHALICNHAENFSWVLVTATEPQCNNYLQCTKWNKAINPQKDKNHFHFEIYLPLGVQNCSWWNYTRQSIEKKKLSNQVNYLQII